MRAWGITPGAAGMEAQVLALGEALGVSVEMKKTQLHPALAWLPGRCLYFLRSWLMRFMVGDKLSPPWPELVISCGRRGAGVALGLKEQLPQTKFIHIQDPHLPPACFDAIVAMGHDKITGPNVIKTRFALHLITPEILEMARQHFAVRFLDYPQPFTAVLLGGSTNKYTMPNNGIKKIINELKQVLHANPGSLLITPSRRTGKANIAHLRRTFAGNPRVYVYDGTHENPYMGMLALADTIIVTNDSVNMMSEAHATGKPLYILPLPGHADTKPARLADALVRDGIARKLTDQLENWNYTPVNEMRELGERVRELL